MTNAQLKNRIGTMVRCNRSEAPDYIRQILPHGFESLQLMWWQHVRHDLPRLAFENCPMHGGTWETGDWNIAHIRFAGPEATDPFALRHYDKNRQVLGRSMEDWLSPAVAYWHSFVANGLDPFGGPTLERP